MKKIILLFSSLLFSSLLFSLILVTSCSINDYETVTDDIASDPPVATDSKYHSLFQNFKPGIIDYQNGFQGNDSFDGESINISNYLTVPILPKNTTVKYLVKAGSNFQTRLNSENLTSFYFICQIGGNINVGNSENGVLVSTSGVVDPNKDYYIEVFFGDTTIKAKAYNLEPKTVWDSEINISGSIGNILTVNEYAGITKIKDILYNDSTVDLMNKVQFNGYWFEERRGAEKLLRTFNQGVSLEFETNSTRAVLEGIVQTSKTPILLVSVDGSTPQKINLSNNNNTILFENQNNSNHKVTVWVEGLYEGDWFWTDSNYGIFVKNILIDSNSYLRKPVDNRKSILIIGDSITEGVNVFGTSGNPDDNSGYNAYSNILARKLNMRPLIHGFGGTGIAVGGSGMVPKYLTSISNYCSGKRAFNETTPNYILINGGTNDSGHNIPSNVFTNEYLGLINYLKNKYPSSTKLVLLVPFNGSFKNEIKNLGVSNNIYVIDMSLFVGITTSDGTHPDLSGNIIMADLLAVELNKIL
ncbi:GDSL-type esterase/lipase family protein [Epilithonimonas sp.]|uniref:GDSL-type esterase/lipase family protein n=1 Tax=Epilithonimonas sp. TaxID=2894511 RepID=UPI0035B4C132